VNARHASVHAWILRERAAVAPADDANEHIFAFGVDGKERSARVALARILAALADEARADHIRRDALGRVLGGANVAAHHRHADFHWHVW